MGAACSRRKQPQEAETPFWEELPKSKEVEEEESKPPPPRGYDEAVHLKDEGKEKYAREEVAEAMDSWARALDALHLPPEPPEDGDEDAPPPKPPPRPGDPFSDDPQVQELRVQLLLNLALGSKKLEQWRHVVGYCEDVLDEQPKNVKALYRKADALGELGELREAEEAVARLEEVSEEGRKLAAQKKDEWRKKRRAADGRQKKMWSAALSEAPKAASAERAQEVAAAPRADAQEQWAAPKVPMMTIFDLRKKGLEWNEDEDFNDAIWKNGLGRREAAFYQKRALPLTVLAGAALAELGLPSELVVHCLLDGNTAPFGQPHDWSSLLQRYPSVKTLTVVYIDIGAVGDIPPDQHSVPYGTLLRPTEEGRAGDRVAHAARFLGTYREFRAHCRELPGLVVPHVAIWADVPLYGFNDDDFATRLEAYELLAQDSVPSLITQGGEIQEPGAPPFPLRVDAQANQSFAILSAGLAARMVVDWCWNRFVVPLDRGQHGIVAAHALLGVVKPKAKNGGAKPGAQGLKDALKKRGVSLEPYKFSKVLPHPHDKEGERLRRQQWEAFSKRLQAQGRPVGPDASPEERNRQAMEFYQFCGMVEHGKA